MPRQRMIKPEFYTSDSLAEVHPMARYLFIGLWVMADDCGNLKYSPRKIRLQVYPFDDIPDREVELQLACLEDIGCIYGYEVDGERFVTIPNFSTYQTINRPSKTTIPCPENVKDRHQIRAWVSSGKPAKLFNNSALLNECSMSTHPKERSKEGSITTYNTSFLPTGSVGGGVEDHPPTPTSNVENQQPATAPVIHEIDELRSVPCPHEIKERIGIRA